MVRNHYQENLQQTKLIQLLLEGLNEAHCSRQALKNALPYFAKESCSMELTSTLDLYAAQTEEDIIRLNKMFKILGENPGQRTTAMKQLLLDANMALENTGTDLLLRDLGLIMAAKKIVGYQTALYDSVLNLAQASGYFEIVALLKTIISQENERQKILSILESSFQLVTGGERINCFNK